MQVIYTRKERMTGELPKLPFFFRSFGLFALLVGCTWVQQPVVVNVQEETSTEVAPTPTNTPEPTATQVAEFASNDQLWLLEEIFPKAREAGCEPTYETSYYPEEANNIPWTVDEDGNMVQGLTELNFCGTEGSGAYIQFYVIGEGWNTPPFEEEAGPNYQASSIITSDLGLEGYVGFLNAEDLDAMQSMILCVKTEIARGNGAPADYVVDTRPDLYVYSSLVFAEAFAMRWEPSEVDTFVDQCR